MKKIQIFLFTLVLSFIFSYRCVCQKLQPPIDTANLSSHIRPADNFYLYVNEKWITNAVIPPTESSAGAFRDVYNTIKNHIHTILDSISNINFEIGSIAQKVGDFYYSGMDSNTIENLGFSPIKSYLKKIASFTDTKSIMQFEAEAHSFNHSYIADVYISPDVKNSSVNILAAAQTGLGLPDRDYYFKEDAGTIKMQEAYQAYITKTFMLLRYDTLSALKKSIAIFALEKEIAKSHSSNVQLRDPETNYHKIPVSDLEKQMTAIGWTSLLKNSGIVTDSINVEQPAYFITLNNLLQTIPIETWKAYYTFHFTNDFADALSSSFVNAKFDFSKKLNGQQQVKPRWERMYASTDKNLGDALGELYVKKYFTGDAKQRIVELVNNLQKAFARRIKNVDWMSENSKKIAEEKLGSLIKKIGYPDKWKDYSNVIISRSNYFNNLISCYKNEYQYSLNKLGKTVDKNEWEMTPPSVGAYYNKLFNEMVLPAGILQFPFFDASADDAVNYGAIGMFIGHEMTHGFDDKGSLFDKEGNLKNWWGTKDSMQFAMRTQAIINQFNDYTVLDTIHLNGALTAGENSADLGGLTIAYDAFRMTKEARDGDKIDGLSPDQRFFISFAQVWRQKIKPPAQRTAINIDRHSPNIWRVNGPLADFDPFYKAFNVQPGNKMYRPYNSRVRIW